MTVFAIRCRTHSQFDCPPCAAIYRRDAKAILRAGLARAAANNEAVVRLTLTAPSFGETHKQKSCNCIANGRVSDDHFPGTPLHPRTYRYRDQVRWNAAANALFKVTMRKVWRAIDQALPEGSKLSSHEYAAVAEMQVRGAIHYHALLLVPYWVIGALGGPGALTSIIDTAVKGAKVRRYGRHLFWGSQKDIAIVSAHAHDAAQSIAYLLKHLGRTVADLTRAAARKHPQLEKHYNCLHAAASRYLRCQQHQDSSATQAQADACEQCTKARNNRRFGWSGHVIRRSRNFAPVNFTMLRERRRQFAANGKHNQATTSSPTTSRAAVAAPAVGPDPASTPHLPPRPPP